MDLDVNIFEVIWENFEWWFLDNGHSDCVKEFEKFDHVSSVIRFNIYQNLTEIR